MCGCGSGTTGLFLGSYEYSNEPSGSINYANFLTSLATISFSNRTTHHGVSYRASSLHSPTNRSMWRVLSCGMSRRVISYKFTDVSDERPAFIFKVEE
jgi:hypothetical protein